MEEKEFNLLDEPWLRVMRADCKIEEVSLTDALLHAHEYTALAGELPTQNAAILRLVLAVLHAVFERVNLYGEAAEIDDAEDALERWEELWKNGRFPEEPILAYLQKQHENFWLFHPEKPFWQIPSAKNGTKYETAKLNGCLSESSNKVRLFPERTGREKACLSYSETARWLVYLNAYDDTSAKPTKAGKAKAGGKLPSPGVGWLGKIGYVCVKGKNLFETLMRNFVLLDGNEEPWDTCIPVWELEKLRENERTEIAVPHDQAALLTLQSRRLIIQREHGNVIGYYLLGGDFFAKENAFSEQMTVWGTAKDVKGNIIGYQPRRHNKSRRMWRDFASYLPTSKDIPYPGVIRWNSYLQYSEILPENEMLNLSISSVLYGDKDFFVNDLLSDSMAVHLNLLSDLGKSYRLRIEEMVTRCDVIARYISFLARDLYLAAGGDKEKTQDAAEQARERYYDAVDVPFRKWLASLDADDTTVEREKKIKVWCKTAYDLAQNQAEQMCSATGLAAFRGKKVKLEKNSEGKYYSAALAMQWFKYYMKDYRPVSEE